MKTGQVFQTHFYSGGDKHTNRYDITREIENILHVYSDTKCCDYLHKFITQAILVTGAFTICIFAYLVLFQYHEEHQYPICGHSKSYHTSPLSCVCSFTDSPHHFDLRDYKLRPLMSYHSENPWSCYMFPVLRIFDTHSNLQEHNPRV
jgi:hypothetical protein